MDPLTWTAIAAAVLIAVIAVADALRRRKVDPVRVEKEEQLRQARRWQEIEARRADAPRDRARVPMKARTKDSNTG